MKPEQDLYSDVLILGGGLAGLSAAYEFEKEGFSGYTIIESAEKTGGLLRTNRESGVEVDELPHVFFSKDKKAVRMFKKMVGKFYSYEHNLGVLWRKDKFIDYPFQNNLWQLESDERREALKGLLDRDVALRRVRNLEEYALKTLGQGIVNLFFRPYNEKLWQTSLGNLGYKWLFSKIQMPDSLTLADSVLGTGRGKEVAPHKNFIYPRKGGIESLAEGLTRHIAQGRIFLKTNVYQINVGKKTVLTNRGRFKYKYLISALPLPEFIRFSNLSKFKRLILKFNATRVLCIQCILKNLNLPDYHWIYVPGEDLPFYRLTRVDLINPNAARGGKVLLIECAMKKSSKELESVLDSSITKLSELGVFRKKDIEKIWHFNHYPSYPIQYPDIEADIENLRSFFENRQVILAGRFGLWRVYNMDHAINSGIEAARAVLSIL